MSDSDSSLDFESADEGALNNDEEINLSDLDLSDDEDVKSKQETPKSNEPSGKVETNVQQNIQAEVVSNSIETKHSNQSVEKTVKIQENAKSHSEIKTENIAKEQLQKVKTIEANASESEQSEHAEKLEPNKPNLIATEFEAKAEEVKKVAKQTNKVENKAQKEATSGWDDAIWDDLDNHSDNEHVSDGAQISPTSQSKKEERNIASETKPLKGTQNTQEKLQPLTRSESSSVANNQTPADSNTASSSWGWSKFGSNFISSALTITAQIGGSINTVLESVEATIGAPDPAELAAKIAKSNSELEAQAQSSTDQTSKFENDWNNDSQEWFTLPPLNKLASTGLDVLESVGKKTFNALHEKDPNLKQTRELLKKVPVSIASMNQKPNLSQLLREAQTEQLKKQEESNLSSSSSSSSPLTSSTMSSKSKSTDKPTFSQFFEEFKGVVHLEGLEMLSRQSSVRFEMFSINKSKLKTREVKESLILLRELFDANNFSDEEVSNDNELDQKCHEDFALLNNNKTNHFDVDHFEFLLNDYSKRSRVKLINLDKVLAAYRTTLLGIKDAESIGELFNHSIKCFALITANIIEFYHKTAQFYLMDQHSNAKSPNKCESLIQNAQTLYMLTRLFVRCVSMLVEDMSKKCKKFPKEKHTNQVVTDIFLEGSNCTTYICDAFLLFLPIFNSQFVDEF